VGLLLPAGSLEASPLSGHFIFCVVADATEVRSSDFWVAVIFATSLIGIRESLQFDYVCSALAE
jgi:hypothetical protein